MGTTHRFAAQAMLSTLEAKKKSTRLLAKPWDKPELADTWADATNKNTLGRSEAMLMGETRDRATAAMRSQRTAREQAKRNGKVGGRRRRCPHGADWPKRHSCCAKERCASWDAWAKTKGSIVTADVLCDACFVAPACRWRRTM